MSAVSHSSASNGYTIRDVARLLGLSPYQVRSFVRGGFLRPSIGTRGEYRFTFQDLVLLRTAKELEPQVPAHKIRSALRKLREQLPFGRELSGVRITANGEDIVVQDGDGAWTPESGQAVLNFDVGELANKVAPLAERRAAKAYADDQDHFLGAHDWYEIGCDSEPIDTQQARDAYRRALELDPIHVDARINLGRILHEERQLKAAEKHYRMALAARPDNSTAAFNLGVLYEDLNYLEDALRAYETAFHADPGYADAFFNAAHVCERIDKPELAIQYLARYRQLARDD